jgi:transposase-like protein
MRTARRSHAKGVALFEGYRESTESWCNVFRDLRDRGLVDPRLLIGDGTLGLWGAIGDVYPHADWQRCWCHMIRNVLSYFPKRLRTEVLIQLRDMYGARTKDQALNLMDDFARRYQKEYPRAVECLLKDRDSLLAFYAYPHEHWQSLKTTNPINRSSLR